MRSLCKKAGILSLVIVALAPALAQADYVRGQPIYARNNTDHRIQVAAYYIPAGGHDFVTGGFWTVYPGQCIRLLWNNGINIYFYAKDDQGWVWEGTDATTTVQGQTLHMFHQDTGPCYDPWEVTFQ